MYPIAGRDGTEGFKQGDNVIERVGLKRTKLKAGRPSGVTGVMRTVITSTWTSTIRNEKKRLECRNQEVHIKA